MKRLREGNDIIVFRRIIRNVFNGTWQFIPNTLADELRKVSTNNTFGEIIKRFIMNFIKGFALKMKGNKGLRKTKVILCTFFIFMFVFNVLYFNDNYFQKINPHNELTLRNYRELLKVEAEDHPA